MKKANVETFPWKCLNKYDFEIMKTLCWLFLLLLNICDSKYWFWCNGNNVNFAVMQSYVRILMSQPFFLWGHCIIYNTLGYYVLIDTIWKMLFSLHCFSSYKWTYTKIPGKCIYIYIYFFHVRITESFFLSLLHLNNGSNWNHTNNVWIKSGTKCMDLCSD